MALEQHTIEIPSGAKPARADRTVIGSTPGVANILGAAGVTVTTAVAIEGLPANYTVVVNPGQGCWWYVDAKTSAGFNVNLVPISSTNVVAAGTFDALVVA